MIITSLFIYLQKYLSARSILYYLFIYTNLEVTTGWFNSGSSWFFFFFFYLCSIFLMIIWMFFSFHLSFDLVTIKLSVTGIRQRGDDTSVFSKNGGSFYWLLHHNDLQKDSWARVTGGTFWCSSRWTENERLRWPESRACDGPVSMRVKTRGNILNVLDRKSLLPICMITWCNRIPLQRYPSLTGWLRRQDLVLWNLYH